jgi:glutamate synthase (ferredoxin)
MTVRLKTGISALDDLLGGGLIPGTMTVVLGATGRNFAAGMSGGEAFVLDEHGLFRDMCNPDMVYLEELVEEVDIAAVRRMLEDHFRYTGSANAERVLADWDGMLPRFVKVMPKAYKAALQERQSRPVGKAVTAPAD